MSGHKSFSFTSDHKPFYHRKNFFYWQTKENKKTFLYFFECNHFPRLSHFQHEMKMRKNILWILHKVQHLFDDSWFNLLINFTPFGCNEFIAAVRGLLPALNEGKRNRKKRERKAWPDSCLNQPDFSPLAENNSSPLCSSCCFYRIPRQHALINCINLSKPRKRHKSSLKTFSQLKWFFIHPHVR